MFYKLDKWKSLTTLSLKNRLMILHLASMLITFMVFLFFIVPIIINTLDHRNPITELTISPNSIGKVLVYCYKNTITTLLSFSLLALIFVGFITRTGMKKIRDFNDLIENISIDELNQRIVSEEMPIELQSLAINFNRLLDRIENLLSQSRQFSADIAHELRDPINYLKGSTELVLSGNMADTDFHELLDQHLVEYKALEKMIDQLLFLSSSENKMIHLNNTEVEISEIFQKITSYYEAISENKQLNIKVSGIEKVDGDEILLSRMINNIYHNALKYTPEKGSIKINIFRIDSEQQVGIEISDSGIGIEECHISKLGKRFYRADSSRSRQTGGLGLGLSIAKSIINLHHGQLTIKSQIGLGTKVLISLPQTRKNQK